MSEYNFESCADIDTLNFAHKLALRPFSEEFQRNIAAAEQAHKDRCFPHQEVYDEVCEEVRMKYVARYTEAKTPLEAKIEKVRLLALRKITKLEQEMEKIRLKIQREHDAHPVIAEATAIYKAATADSDATRDIEVQPFWDEYQAKIATITAEYQAREKELQGGTRMKRYVAD